MRFSPLFFLFSPCRRFFPLQENSYRRATPLFFSLYAALPSFPRCGCVSASCRRLFDRARPAFVYSSSLFSFLVAARGKRKRYLGRTFFLFSPDRRSTDRSFLVGYPSDDSGVFLPPLSFSQFFPSTSTTRLQVCLRRRVAAPSVFPLPLSLDGRWRH